LADLWQNQAVPLLSTGEQNVAEGEPVTPWLLYVALLPLLFFQASLLAKRDVRAVYGAYPLLFLLLYAGIGRVEAWYWPSFVIFSTLLLFTASADLVAKLVGHGALSRWKAAEILSVAVFALFLGANHYSWGEAKSGSPRRSFIAADDPRADPVPQFERERFRGYRRAAMQLNALKDEPGSALISEVGVFGYFYEGDVIDAVGLCSPEAIRFYPPPKKDIYSHAGRRRMPANNIVPSPMITRLKPEYVVNSKLYIDHLLRPRFGLLKVYTYIGTSGTAWNYPIELYQRKAGSSKKQKRKAGKDKAMQ
jgi:hypothetical protein